MVKLHELPTRDRVWLYTHNQKHASVILWRWKLADLHPDADLPPEADLPPGADLPAEARSASGWWIRGGGGTERDPGRIGNVIDFSGRSLRKFRPEGRRPRLFRV